MKIHNFTICDQVRVEDNGKFLLIGVYTNSITFQQLPAQFNVSFWMLAEHEKTGPADFAFRGRMPELGVDLFEVSGGFEINELEAWTPFGFAVTTLVGQAGKMVLEVRDSNGEWIELRSVNILKGTVPQFPTLAN